MRTEPRAVSALAQSDWTLGSQAAISAGASMLLHLVGSAGTVLANISAVIPAYQRTLSA